MTKQVIHIYGASGSLVDWGGCAHSVFYAGNPCKYGYRDTDFYSLTLRTIHLLL